MSIFGPGRGESILIHVGGNRWITIDSCLGDRDNTSPALNYLEAIGVDIEAQVELVIATHAHDDHTAGISQLFSAAKSARFVTSSAFTSSEFFATVLADADIERQLNQSVRGEYRAVIEEARQRGGRSERPIVRASEQRVLLAPQTTWAGGPIVSVTALSPSDTAVDRAVETLAEGAARSGDRKRLAAPDPNEYSVAIWVEVGETALLFGADLLIGPSGCGWKAVESSHRPTAKASLFKVPHHGSAGSHYEATWNDLVVNDVVSLLTPFRMGDKSIPRDSDLARIDSLSGATYLTARPQQPAPSRELKATRARLPAFVRNVRERDGLPGHIQARLNFTDAEWTVRLAPPAYRFQ